jgi:HAD-superfamily hydrolase, subfamily IIB
VTAPPIAVDIDGTLTDATGRLGAPVIDALAGWPAPVIIATGKAMPYAVALCYFCQIDETVIAENGGISLVAGQRQVHTDEDVTAAATEALRKLDPTLGWGRGYDTINAWRETEVAVGLEMDRAAVDAVAAEFDLRVLDTGFAYHLTSRQVSKGDALGHVTEVLDIALEDVVAIGDSENDVSMFECVGESFALANADSPAKAAASHVIGSHHHAGFLEVLDDLRVA